MIKLRTQVSLGQGSDSGPRLDLDLDAGPGPGLGSTPKTGSRIGGVLVRWAGEYRWRFQEQPSEPSGSSVPLEWTL